jgi:hypothetical protein
MSKVIEGNFGTPRANCVEEVNKTDESHSSIIFEKIAQKRKETEERLRKERQAANNRILRSRGIRQ